MPAQSSNSKPRGMVLFSAFNESGELVLEQALSVVDYYEEFHPILDDDNEFRRERGIRLLNGKIYDYDGNLDQEFDNEYDKHGAYVGGRARHADGTIVEH